MMKIDGLLVYKLSSRTAEKVTLSLIYLQAFWLNFRFLSNVALSYKHMTILTKQKDEETWHDQQEDKGKYKDNDKDKDPLTH